jgi:hypothetical protein
MKPLGKAFASTLIGWYLLQPPMVPGSDIYYTGGPLSQWKITASFHSASQCRARRKALIHEFVAATLPSPEQLRKQGMTVQDWIAGKQSGIDEFVRTRCVADDDPRLKEKP